MHCYRGYHSDGGQCRIRIYEGKTPADPPIVIATELPKNENTSITNMVEMLAAEVLLAYLPHRKDEALPFVWIEHYVAERYRGEPESLAEVTFANYTPHRIMTFRAERYSLSSPTWKHITRPMLNYMIGGALPVEYATESPFSDAVSPAQKS